LIVTVLNALLGALNAIAVRPIPPAAFTYLIGAIAALLAAYGLQLDQEAVGAINGAIISVLTFRARGQVTPTVSPRPVDGVIVAQGTPPGQAPAQERQG
jgi:hypothetical protein